MQHCPLFSQTDIDRALQREITISNQDAKLKILTNWKNGIVTGKILSRKEEQLQSEFMNKIFGEVLGYTYEKHLTEWQLENEVKTEFDGKKI